MKSTGLAPFRQVWLVDFGFHQAEGDRPTPICMVGREYHTGRTVHVWADELADMPSPPWI